MLNIVIPMAGRGSRFSSAGYVEPKPLISLNNKRMIDVVIKNLTPSQPHIFIFICQKAHLQYYNYEKTLKKLAPKCIIIAIDEVTAGAACTTMVASQYINNDQALMIANSDQWVDINIDDYLGEMTTKNFDGLIMTMKANDAKWSYAELHNTGLVKRVVEKVVISDEATVGVYNYKHGWMFCKSAMSMILGNHCKNGEFYIAPAYNHMIAQGYKKIGIYNVGSVNEGMYGLGTPSDLELFKKSPVFKKATLF